MNSSNAHNPHVGDTGELWFAYQLPTGWIWQPPRRDVGKDALIVVKDGSDLQNLEFSVQVKTTTRLLARQDHVLCSGIATSSVLYWFSSPQPTLLVVIDASSNKGWYTWHFDAFTTPDEIRGKKTCSARIPTSNLLDAAGWLAIRDRLRRHYSGLSAR